MKQANKAEKSNQTEQKKKAQPFFALQALRDFFIRPWPLIRQRPGYALFLGILGLLFFWLSLELLADAFRMLWVDNFLARLSRRHYLLGLAWEMHEGMGRPLGALMQPLVVHLATTFAFALTTLFSGLIMDRLSIFAEIRNQDDNAGAGMTGTVNPAGAAPEPGKRKPGSGPEAFSGSWAFIARQELRMLSVNLCLTGLLLAIYVLFPGTQLARIAFYVLAPPLYGLANLSYPFLRRGIPYVRIFKMTFARPFYFYSYALVSASGYFLILLLIEKLPAASWPAFLVLGIFGIFRPFGVVSGTMLGQKLAANALPHPHRSPNLRAAGHIFTVGALIVLATYGQLAWQSSTKLDMVDCIYSIEDPDWNSSLWQPGLSLVLDISNPLPRRVHLEKMTITLEDEDDRDILRGDFSGGQIKGRSAHKFALTLKVKSAAVISSLIDRIKNGGEWQLEARVRLDLWFGEIPWPLWQKSFFSGSY